MGHWVRCRHMFGEEVRTDRHKRTPAAVGRGQPRQRRSRFSHAPCSGATTLRRVAAAVASQWPPPRCRAPPPIEPAPPRTRGHAATRPAAVGRGALPASPPVDHPPSPSPPAGPWPPRVCGGATVGSGVWCARTAVTAAARERASAGDGRLGSSHCGWTWLPSHPLPPPPPPLYGPACRPLSLPEVLRPAVTPPSPSSLC